MWRFGAVWLTASSGLLCACNLLLDADEKQCYADADCWGRGLSGSTCVANLCRMQAPTPPANTSSTAGGAAVSVEPPAAGVGAGTAGSRAAPAPSTDVPRASAGSSGEAGRASSAGTGIAPAGGTGGGIAAPASGSAGNMAAAGSVASACSGSGCPECSTDADCERRGFAGGRCADSVCWPPAAECSIDSDCVAKGPEFMGGRCVAAQCRPNPRWRCEVEPPPETGSELKELSVLVRDSLSINPIPDVRIVACQKLDLMCAKPMVEGRTGKDGYLHISLPANFAGYLQQTDRSDYAPAMYFLPQAFPANGELQPFPLLGSGVIIDALALALGAGIDPKRGNMMLIAEDCFGMALPGVMFSSPQQDKSTVQFYVRDLLPDPSAMATADVGNGGYLNFPAGTAVLNLKLVETGLDLATVSVLVRPGFISVAYIRPRPR